ncbi:MAG TPA: HlyD family type I secretion periplasmic adaptor subunit, partial [Burkholderiaceae bacterium]|nr:HlyD family type I secretion periplasmic adaptor subunit [Burkholderiaceae bacterium]
MNARDDTTALTPMPGARAIGALERVRVALEPVTNKLLGPTLSDADAAAAGIKTFEREADALISRQRTRGAQKIVRGAAIAVAALLVWAALAPVDEVTRGDARVIPSRQLQVVQSLDGGVVAEILVREGQVVEAG